MNHEPWRRLEVGDQIRIVRLPSDWKRPGAWVWPETLALYRHLIAEKAVLTVHEKDEWGQPWVSYAGFQGSYLDTFAVNDDSWILVTPRQKRSKTL